MFTYWQGYHSHNRGEKLGTRNVYARYIAHELKIEQKQQQTSLSGPYLHGKG
jgi:hypothetical protein